SVLHLQNQWRFEYASRPPRCTPWRAGHGANLEWHLRPRRPRFPPPRKVSSRGQTPLQLRAGAWPTLQFGRSAALARQSSRRAVAGPRPNKKARSPPASWSRQVTIFFGGAQARETGEIRNSAEVPNLYVAPHRQGRKLDRASRQRLAFPLNPAGGESDPPTRDSSPLSGRPALPRVQARRPNNGLRSDCARGLLDATDSVVTVPIAQYPEFRVKTTSTGCSDLHHSRLQLAVEHVLLFGCVDCSVLAVNPQLRNRPVQRLQYRHRVAQQVARVFVCEQRQMKRN